MSTYTLITQHNISSATIDRLRRGGGISTMKLDDLCRILSCRGEEVVEYLPDPPAANFFFTYVPVYDIIDCKSVSG